MESVDEGSEAGIRTVRCRSDCFDEEQFIEKFKNKKRQREKCCGKTCLLKLKEANVRIHASLLSFYSTIQPPDLRNRLFRVFVMTCYLQTVNEKGNCAGYRLPAFSLSCCLHTWLQLLDISRATFFRWKSIATSNRDVVPRDHGLVASASNQSKPESRALFREFVIDIAKRYGHPLPIMLRRNDKSLVESEQEADSIIILPPRFTKRYIHKEFLSLQQDDSSKFCFATCLDVFQKDLAFIRVSLRSRGLCDVCMVYRDSLRTLPSTQVSAKGKEWKTHIDAAEMTRAIYRKSLVAAKSFCNRLESDRLPLAAVSYDYAKQLSIPKLSAQSMNEWFAEKKGYDVNIFGIVNEGVQPNGKQYNYIYGEGTKHGSIQVASMMHHFLSKTCPLVGNAKVLHLHSDSCTGQNKNNFVLGYYMLRVAHGHHDEILWHFMAVGHTKFRPDEGFGLIRQHVDGRANILCFDDMKRAIEHSSFSNECVLFPVSEVQDWKKVSDYYRALPGIRKNFAYKIHIRSVVNEDRRDVLVDVYHSPDRKTPDLTVSLLKPNCTAPAFDTFPIVPVQPLTQARRSGLEKDVYSVLRKSRIEMSDEAHAWWRKIIGDAA